jgi:hypothetical protein
MKFVKHASASGSKQKIWITIEVGFKNSDMEEWKSGTLFSKGKIFFSS